ncbi:DUF924 family protein [uncultured Cohaesibacter sp.]|uniref:DUF924 family protein n=1 Tax=uncultured Cohaesibacter sp. TaxID=1002546 RepID=UPI0029C85051|nr:DUF924 family protein [uncultured Cohaesibacter sp.]
MIAPNDVLDFWFSADPKLWFAKNNAFDMRIRVGFGMALEEARQGRLDDWRETFRGKQALIILLDQFSRNLYRGLPAAFSHDAVALGLAHEMVLQPEWHRLSAHEQQFAVMPMMHSEDLSDQQCCLKWMEQIGQEGAIKAAREHLNIISRFGRFPHRNAVLGRQSSAEERQFLAEGGFAG